MLMQKDYRSYFRPSELSANQSRRQENIRNLYIHEHDELTHYLDITQNSSAKLSRHNEKGGEGVKRIAQSAANPQSFNGTGATEVSKFERQAEVDMSRYLKKNGNSMANS